MPDDLENYYRLVAKVDRLCGSIRQQYRRHIACRKGCAHCCVPFSLFAVEGRALLRAFQNLPAVKREKLGLRLKSGEPAGVCPLLDNGSCALYDARPIICRTHGMPIVTVRAARQRADCCPLNFKVFSSLPGDATIALDQLNQLLAAINNIFCSANAANRSLPERQTMVQALLIDSCVKAI